MVRAHRIGQMYRLVSKDTVEENVLEREKKEKMLDYASEWLRLDSALEERGRLM